MTNTSFETKVALIDIPKEGQMNNRKIAIKVLNYRCPNYR